MSRLIVKNLPKRVSTNYLKEVFSSKGQITDVQLKYTKDGVFRQFAFIGYKTVDDAQAAKEYFNNSCFGTTKIQVELCSDLGDSNKPKSWSKYSKDSLTYEKNHKIKEKDIIQEKSVEQEERSNKKLSSKFQETLNEIENDEEFTQFMEVQRNKKNKLIWSNDNEDFSISNKTDISSTDDEKTEIEFKNDEKEDSVLEEENKKSNKSFDNEFTVKLRGLPYKCKKKEIKQFFHPLKIKSLRIPPKVRGIAYVKLNTEKEMKQALNKHRSFMSGHRIDVIKYIQKETNIPKNVKLKQLFYAANQADEEVNESGRIFVRNLSYTVAEEELENLFKSYGTLTEVHLPVDKFTRKIKGFAFVTFMFPEHAAEALSKLDGTSFQGRLLHLIPAKQKPTPKEEPILNFKQEKLAKLKELCGSSHNWNALFLGANAVADVLAEKYHTTKAKVLNAQSKDSLAVRMALGETQIVAETRQFLLDHGVQLDAFSQPAAERSKTVILVKNLPANTNANNVKEIFSKFGVVKQVLLPPSGITAVVEFEVAAEARTAFKNLSYSKFQHVPLYLEWAPGNVFNTSKDLDTKEEYIKKTENEDDKIIENTEMIKTENESDDTEDDDDEVEENSTLFIKNINFETTEENLKEHFSKVGPIYSVTIAKKKDIKNPGSFLSMGYGFVQYKYRKSAQSALKELQHSKLDGHMLELKISERATQSTVPTRKKQKDVKQISSKILIKNIPFEAKQDEIRDLFRTFGELKFVRLPKKAAGTGSHRGFGFVEFLMKNDAKRAFKTLCHSTHLYGRRLVLEWAHQDEEIDISTLKKKSTDELFNSPAKMLKKSSLMKNLKVPTASSS